MVLGGATAAMAFESWYVSVVAEQAPPPPLKGRVWRSEPACAHPCRAACAAMTVDAQRRRGVGFLYRGRNEFRIG